MKPSSGTGIQRRASSFLVQRTNSPEKNAARCRGQLNVSAVAAKADRSTGLNRSYPPVVTTITHAMRQVVIANEDSTPMINTQAPFNFNSRVRCFFREETR